MSKTIPDTASETKAVKLRILDKEVQIACKAGEENDLAKAAAHVDKSMRELRLKNASSNIEKIAIVTAINTANALLQSRSIQVNDSSSRDSALSDKAAKINSELEALLNEPER